MVLACFAAASASNIMRNTPIYRNDWLWLLVQRVQLLRSITRRRMLFPFMRCKPTCKHASHVQDFFGAIASRIWH